MPQPAGDDEDGSGANLHSYASLWREQRHLEVALDHVQELVAVRMPLPWGLAGKPDGADDAVVELREDLRRIPVLEGDVVCGQSLQDGLKIVR